MSSLGTTLLHVIAVLAGAAGVAYGAANLSKMALLEAQWATPAGKKTCSSNGLKVAASTKTMNQVFMYGGLGLILVAFILAHMGSFGGMGFGMSMMSSRGY